MYLFQSVHYPDELKSIQLQILVQFFIYQEIIYAKVMICINSYHKSKIFFN